MRIGKGWTHLNQGTQSDRGSYEILLDVVDDRIVLRLRKAHPERCNRAIGIQGSSRLGQFRVRILGEIVEGEELGCSARKMGLPIPTRC